jgi:hypothetical protein
MHTKILSALGVGLAVAWSGAAAAQVIVETPPPDAPPPRVVVVPETFALDRLAFIYSPEIALSNSSLRQALNKAAAGDGVHNLGFEYSTQTGWVARYHAQLDFTSGYGLNGVRIEPLGVGWALPLIRGPGVGLEIEPLLSLADGLFLFSNQAGSNGNGNVTFLLSSGAEVQVNLTLGAFYAFASPIGFELRYLEVTNGSGGTVTTGADAYWRFRVGIGFQY